MSIAFLLIIVSALFHAVWNMLVKISDDKVMYNVHIQISTAFFISLYTAIFHPEAFYIHKDTILYALLSSFFFSLLEACYPWRACNDRLSYNLQAWFNRYADILCFSPKAGKLIFWCSYVAYIFKRNLRHKKNCRQYSYSFRHNINKA